MEEAGRRSVDGYRRVFDKTWTKSDPKAKDVSLKALRLVCANSTSFEPPLLGHKPRAFGPLLASAKITITFIHFQAK